MGVTVPDTEYAAEALGYAFEQVVLYAVSLGLGTCWLGGTFNRSAFTAAMHLEPGELFPILSPLGYPAKKKSLTEQIMRKTVKASARMPWEELFFINDFKHPLSETDAGKNQFPLEMVRLAPSAVNKQPWRVVVVDGRVHFFEKRAMKVEAGSVDMQRIDVGIAVCHFHLAVTEQGRKGHFVREIPDFSIPEGTDYIVSWEEEDTSI